MLALQFETRHRHNNATLILFQSALSALYLYLFPSRDVMYCQFGNEYGPCLPSTLRRVLLYVALLLLFFAPKNWNHIFVFFPHNNLETGEHTMISTKLVANISFPSWPRSFYFVLVGIGLLHRLTSFKIKSHIISRTWTGRTNIWSFSQSKLPNTASSRLYVLVN